MKLFQKPALQFLKIDFGKCLFWKIKWLTFKHLNSFFKKLQFQMILKQ